MQLKGIKIDGFGIHRDLEINNLSPGLNVIYGRNEEGKTTLKHFISTILFGFKPRNDNKRYEPVNGGSHGGKIYLNYEGNIIEVSRILMGSKSNTAPKIICHGERENDIAQDQILRGISSRIFDNVFSFGLDELNNIKNLTDKEVMDYIYTAGLGLPNLSLKNIRKKLTGEIDEVWKARSRKGLNHDIDKLNNIIKDKISIQQQGEKYLNLKTRIIELDQLLSQIEYQKRVEKKQLNELHCLVKGVSVYKEISEIEKQLKIISLKGEYSIEDMSDLQSLKDRTDEIGEDIMIKKGLLSSIESKISNINVNTSLLHLGGEIQDLSKEIPLQRQLLSSAEDGRRRLDRVSNSLKTKLSKINGMLVDDIEKIEIPIGIEEQLENIYSTYLEKQRELEILRKEKQNLETENQELLGQLAIEEKSEGLKEVISLLLEVKGQFVHVLKGDRAPLLLVSASFVVIFALASQGDSTPSLAIFSLAALSLTLYYIINNLIVPKKRFTAIKRRLKKHGVYDTVTRGNIDMVIKNYEQKLYLIEKLERDIEKNRIKREEKDKNINEVKSFLLEINFEKQVILQKMGLNKEISIPLSIQVMATIHEIKVLMEEQGDLLNLLEGNKKKRDSFINKVTKLVSDLSYTTIKPEFEDLVGILDKISYQLEENLQNESELNQLKGNSASLKEEISVLKLKEKELEKRINLLLGKACVKTRDEYIKNFAIYQKVVELKDKREKLISKMETIFINNENLMDRCKEITDIDLQDNIEQLENKIELLTEEIKRLLEEKGRILHEIEVLEKGYNFEQVIYEEQFLKDKIKKDVEKWCTNKLGLALLEKTVKEYEDKYQPEVFKKAQQYFSYMTEGKYIGIKLRGETQEIEVLDCQGRRISSQFLSRGTQEQLYICVRLGLVEEFNLRKGGVPALFDDIFVNFDDSRTEKALEVLLDFCKRNQTIFFTCHQRIIDILIRMGNNSVNIVNL